MAIEQKFKPLLNNALIIPEKVYDGLLLIWYADLVVSGGGTMNREAAALGVPVYSIFRGKLGAVDRFLTAAGKLILIESSQDVKRKILLNRRTQRTIDFTENNPTLSSIAGLIQKLAE